METPERLFQAIPKELEANIAFRKELLTRLAHDASAKNDFLAKCFCYPPIFFDTCLWCPSPRLVTASRHSPFILFPCQEKGVLKLKEAIEKPFDIVFDKSRDMGATFIICGVGLLNWLLVPEFQMFWGSRVEDLVDASTEIMNNMVVGNEKCIFYKVMYLLNNLPSFLKPAYLKKHLMLQNMENGARMEGSTTNSEFGKGSRASAIVVDEFAAIPPKLAMMVMTNLADVGGCCVFNSTQGQWVGSHPYDKILSNGSTAQVTLDWKDHPTKRAGLYRSTVPGKVTILDSAYYKANYPDVFDNIHDGSVVDIDDVAGTYPFVADGGVSSYHQERSVWIDDEWKRPGRTNQSMSRDVYRIATGSSEGFFAFEMIERLRANIRPPQYIGNIEYRLDADGLMAETDFVITGGNGHLSWFSDLPTGRPHQGHNYAVGVDLSRGTGTSNSVATVVDVNTHELVGVLVTPYLRIEKFAELSVAMCVWIGGAEPTILCWEENGANEFLSRVEELGYENLYTKETRTMKHRYGWRSTPGPNGTKVQALNSLDAALHEGLRDNPQFDWIRIYDEQTINELADYVWYDGRVDVGKISQQTESSGAKAVHGDRCIACAVALLASKGVVPGKWEQPEIVPAGSFLERVREKQRQEDEAKRESRIWIW